MLKQLNIEKLSHDGRGIARDEGKTLFVAGTLSGETVTAQLIKSHKRFDEYETREVHTTNAQRSEPVCSHFGSCGGCQLQHLSPDAQIMHKQSTAQELIQRSSGLQAQQLLPNIQGQSTGYRSRARLSAWYHSRNKEYRIGFREAASKNIIDIQHCPILHTQLNSLLPFLGDLCKQLKLEKELGHIDLQLHEIDQEAYQAALSLRVLKPLTEAQHSLLQDFAKQHDCLVHVQDHSPKAAVSAYPHRMQYWLPKQNIKLNFGWGDFTQANRLLNRSMVSRAVELLQLKPNDKVLDGFCGLGNFSLAIAQQAESVIGVEGSLAMTEQAQANAELNNLSNTSFLQRNLMDADSLKTLSKKKFNKALIDPPRDGAKALCEMLCKHKVERLVYVSCDPANLARDAKILATGKYQLESLFVNDMFPHSSHSEVTACFTYASKKKQTKS